jgi:hypothetical protein
MFAIIALIVAVLGLFGIGSPTFMVLLTLALLAGHFAFGTYVPGLTRRDRRV